MEEMYRMLINEEEGEEEFIIGGSLYDETLSLLNLASSSDAPLLITGETGTGKSLMAKVIHYKRGNGNGNGVAPFISINCAAIPETLVEAEVFGYEKGAFTGAVTAKKGIFEMAEGGTLLLDEIGDMPLHLQTKLLNVIEDKKLRRLGGESIRPVNVRIMATTSLDLENSLGKYFRKDLYYRLNVIRIRIPPLRERREDIPELCNYLLRKITNGNEIELSASEIEELMTYEWPGNVRELKNIIEMAFFSRIGLEIRPSIILKKEVNAQKTNYQDLSADYNLNTLDEIETKSIKQVLDKFSGNITKTAGILGISISTLKRKIKKYGLK